LTGLLAAGAITVGMTAASANTAGFCSASSTSTVKATCTVTETIGKCLNDRRSGGNGSRVILYTCNGGANEIWTHHTNGEFVLKANGGTYCLDDPASSTHDGTQLIVWTCKNSANQHWNAALR
jgi:hypothetical protein